MFDLENALTAWRQQMLARGIKSPDVLAELEAHLREDVAHRISSGAGVKEAFDSAVGCLGRPEALTAEFAKLETKGARSGLGRTCRYIVPACMLGINTWTLLAYDISPLERTLGICAVTLICLYLVRWPGWADARSDASYGLLAKAVKLAINLLWLWPLWALLESLGVVRSGLGIAATTVLWCLYAALAMTVITECLKPRCRRLGGSGGSPPPFQPTGQPIPPTRPRPPEFPVALRRAQAVDAAVQRSLEVAADEANRFGHDFVGTEHLLLALLRLAGGSFAGILQRMNLDPETIRLEVERLSSSPPVHASTSALRLTPRASKALELAGREAKALRHPRIAAEHLFLGLLVEGSGIAAVVLRNLGIQIERTREEILNAARAHPT